MTIAYVKIGFDFNEVLAISSLQTPSTDLKVILDDDLVDFSKVNGYIAYAGDDGQNHLKFDEDRYNEYIKEQKRQESVMKGEQLKQELTEKTVLNNASDEDAYVMRYLYGEWSGDGITYKTNDRLMYNDKFYKVLQDHTSQSDWTPDTASSLYVEIADPSNEYPEFKQPTGAHDAYAKGSKVTFEGKKYISLIDANVYSPTAYPAGWSLVE
ncbi:MAG: hypothetical protein PUE66_08140 [Erysipelotrichaceae bacterium]|nr:hypothetical protein [Erysipelotrichaceae bacterium]